MPQRALRICAHPGCGKRTKERFCPKHVQQFNKSRNREDRYARGSAAKRGYGHRWRQARERYLADHPFCVVCEGLGMDIVATVVDHIKDHKKDPKLFWNVSNWQALCKCHHDQKTARENPR